MRTRVIVLLLAGTGCSPSYAYQGWVRDPGAVRLESTGGVALAEGRTEERVKVESGVAPTGPGTSTRYTLYAERGDRGSLTLDLDVGAALVRGERITLVDQVGGVLHPTFASRDFEPQGPDLHVPYCASLSATRGGYSFSAAPTCASTTLGQGELVTPRSNVLRVTEQRRASLVGPIVLGSGILLTLTTLGGSLPLILGDPDTRPIGWGILGTGLATVLVGGIIMLTSEGDRDSVIYSR
jgi:hypothetical protein